MNNELITIGYKFDEAVPYVYYWNPMTKMMYANLNCPYCSHGYVEVPQDIKYLECKNCHKVFRVQI